MSKELAKSLLEQRVIDISQSFPVANGDEYLELALELFKAGVYRIPIIGTKVGSSITSLILVSNDIQEHAQLGREIALDPNQIAYTASIEGYPFNDTDPFLFYLKILSTNDLAYQRIGRGSDFYPQSLSQLGIKELSRIFVNIGVLQK